MPKQAARDSCLVAVSDTIHRVAVSLGLGDVLTTEALWYLECSSNSTTSQPITDVWSAACLYLAIRMHQLPISPAQVAAAAGQDSRMILKFFQKVATACAQTPPPVDFTKFTLHSMAKVPGVQPATKVKVLNLYVKLIAWLEKARTKTCVNNSWAAAACQDAMTFYKVEIEPQHLIKLFGSKEAFTNRVHELRQLLVAAAKGLPSNTYPECLAHISVLPVPPASAHFTDQGGNDDNDDTLEALENTTSRASDLSVEGDVTAAPGTAAASSCKAQVQRPATSATADVPQQAALSGAYAKLAVHDMVNMHDVPLPIKIQVLQLYVRLMVWLGKDTSAASSYWAAAALQIAMLHYKIPFLPSNLAGHVKVDMLGERAHDIKQLLTAAAHSSCISYSVCLHKIASMPCSMLPPLPEPTQAAASGKVPQAANSIYPLDATASSQQQKQANMPAVVQSTVPVPPLEASPGQFEQQHAADSADTHVDEAFNGTEAASQAEPAPAADPAQQGVASLATCAPSSTPIQPSLTPQGAPAAQHMAVTNSSELRSQTEAAALMIEEAVLDGRHTADLDPGTVPHPLVLTPHRSPSPPVLSAASAAASAKVPADPGQVSVDPSKVTHLPQTTALAFESRRIQLAQMWLAGGVVPLASTLQASSPLPLNAAGPHTQVSAVDGQMHPSAHALTPQATGVEQGPPAPAVRAQLPVAQTDDAVMSDDSYIGLQKLQSGMLMSRVQVAEQAQRLMLQPVLRRLSHSSSEGNRAPSTADRLAQHKQSQAQIPVSGEQRSAPQLQSAVACLVSPPQTAGPQLVAAAPQLQAVNPQATNRQASTAALQAPISASQLMGLVSSNNVSLQKLQPFGAQSSAGLAQGGTLRQLSKPSQLRSAVSMSPQPTAAQHQREEGRALESALRPASMPAQLISAAAASPQLRVANVQSSSLQVMHTLQANAQEHGDPPLPAQGVPMQQQQQQPLAMLHGPAVQQLHKLLQQMESTAQTNAMLTAQSLGPPAQPNEHLHAATAAGHALEDGLPASWVRAAPAHSQQHVPQQAVPVSPPAAGISEGDLSPWGLLPGPLHAAIACAMAQGGASPTLGGSPRAAQGLSLVRPDGAQGRGVKRPRADSAARTASTSRPGQGAQHVDTVSAHAAHILASGPAAAQVKSASIRSSDTAGKRYLTMRLSSASEPAASVQLGSNLRLADGGTAGSAQQVDSSTPADLTHAANLAVEAVPTQQARSAPQSVSPAAGFDSPVQAASALRDDSPQAAKQTQLKVPASEKALCDSWEQHLNGKQDTCQGSPPLHDGSPGGLQPANSPAKRGRSEATLDVSMSGAEQNADIDVDVSRIATPLRRKLVGVDDMAPPSSQLRRINEQEAQDALLLLHDHEPEEALQQQQGTDSDSRAGAREQDASVISDEHDMTKDTIVRPPPFTDVDGNPDAYEVDRIIDHKSWYAGSLVRMQYLVRWKGYGPEDDTWQSKTSLRHAREAIQDYHNSTQ